MTAPEGDRGEGLAPVIHLRPANRPAVPPPGRPAPAAAPSVQHPADDDPADPADDAFARATRSTAEHVAVSALARRGLSRREVERVLRSRDFDDATIAEQIDQFERSGLVDDLALAQNLVATLQERKGLGRTGIAAELTRRLMAPVAIEYALDLIDTGDELERARELALKRAPQLRSYGHETAVRRLSGFLARRGYSGSVVRAAVEHALPRTGASSSDRSRSTDGVRFR